MGRRLRILLALALAAGSLPAQELYAIDTIRTIAVTIAQPNWRTVMANNYASQTCIKADVTIDGKTYKDVGVRHRGYSTYRFLPANKTDKRPWKIAVDEYVPGQRIQGYRTLNLNNNIWDPSFMREVVGYEYMRAFVPAPKCCFVKLEVNGEDLGLFTNAQQINKDFLEEWFPDDEGNRYRGERASTQTPYSDTALTWLGTSQARYEAAYELKTEGGLYPPWTRLIHAIDVLNNTPAAALPAELPKVIDIDDALRFLAVANITAWLDSYIGMVCKNFYIYEDPYHGRLRFQPWDMNNGFGGLTFELGVSGIARMDPFYNEKSATNPRPLFGQIVQRPEWRARYLAHYRHMLASFGWNTLGTRLEQLRTFIRPELEKDSKRIYTMQQFDQNVLVSINVGFVTVPGLQPFFQDREAFLRAHAEVNKVAPTLTALTHAPENPGPQETVWVNVTVTGATPTAVTLYSRTRGPFIETPMLDDGQHHDGQPQDGVFGAAVPPASPLDWVEYYVGAAGNLAAGGAMAFLPPTASFQPPGYRVGTAPPTGPIVLSELMAKNDNGIRDEFGEREDWIELVNTASTAVDVSGMYLTDNPSHLDKWPIPTGSVLQPGQTLLVWADEDGGQGPLHANFKLSADGEEVALVATDGKTVLDRIAFGPQQPDIATGRLAGFPGLTFSFPVPTPHQPNRADPCGHLPYGGADPMSARFALTGLGKPTLGASVSYATSNAPPTAPGLLAVATAPFPLEVAGWGPLLVNPAGAALLPLTTDASGVATARIPIPQVPPLAGSVFYFQAFVHNGTNGGLSSAVATRIGP
ncbi:MAG: CotH kinase family protein [Planctomycetes bacterium]|nr:CotH kinase family protein [Planctomycetota bacterium]